jgi:UDP-N-acetylmuramoyl-tripeptide--D-alanyl-D-alanine ligase
MMESTLVQAAKSMQGNLLGTDNMFRGVSTDTRTLREGELFFALQGPNFDGREFVAAAATKQAVAAVVEARVDAEIANITVSDTRVALGELAASWRQQMPAKVIAVTGSNGKTTVKEMIASCLSLSAKTLATDGNLNNDIGLPLMMLRLDREHEFAVLELGANHAGEIGYLTGLASPHIVLITNAAPAHLEGFGSVAGVAQAKGEILQGIQKPECAVLNRGDEYFALWESMAGDVPIVSFGGDERAAVYATNMELTVNGSRFTLHMPNESFEVSLPLSGAHNVLNACAAAAAATALGINPQQILAGLEQVRPVSGRLQAIDGFAGANLFDDSYNANPASVIAAAEFLAAQEGESCLVLGDMAELGTDAGALHESVGMAIRSAGVTHLFATGQHSKRAISAFGEHGEWFATVDLLIAALKGSLLQSGKINVLVKGSRSMRMERVIEALVPAEIERKS